MAEHANRRSMRGPILALVLAGLLLYVVQRILLPFVIAAVIAYAASPLIHWVRMRTGLPRAIPALAFFFIVVAALGLLGYSAYVGFKEQIIPFLSDMQGTLEGMIHHLLGERRLQLFGTDMDARELAEKATAAARDWLDPSRVLTIAGVGIAGAFAGVLFLVLLAYLLLTGPKVADGLFWLVPPERRVEAHRLWTRIDPVLKRYFIGVAIVVACTAALAYLGLGLALQLPHAVILALMTGFLEIVPVVGPAASALIAGLVAIQEAKSVWAILAYAGYATALRVVVDNILGPIILGRAGRIHPVMVMFCFLVGGFLFGIIGVILAVPTALVVKTSLATFYDDDYEAEGQGP